ncbi:MgtC/SapB family protein [Baia soyae]|uniref:Putative Mg2+ transporter-C (MgtC) family protein n=1 Tax=Baia soyae TaxID=1544746 RepID=A0A4R2RSD6_9BACL|nr:MgtC/SapB family protein [Baia soyae]TCP66243.1 putative Mg2+ transporter-C (MgtC) family protein [Baia soyae]
MSSIWYISEWEMVLRLMVAAVLGGLVGWEREVNNHPAGFRTHILVSVGSALIMLISIYAFVPFMEADRRFLFDPARLSAQVVSGIGFLGAGTILRQGVTVSGLTTAASLWVIAAIGLAVGSGFYFAAVITTLLVLVSLELLNRIEKYMVKKCALYQFEIIIQGEDRGRRIGDLATYFAGKGIQLKKLRVDEEDEASKEFRLTITLRLNDSSEESLTNVIGDIQKIEGVHEVRRMI